MPSSVSSFSTSSSSISQSINKVSLTNSDSSAHGPQQLPPFLAKLLLLTQSTDKNASHWDASGKVYLVRDDYLFNQVLKKFFKGTAQTFIRQLHFYGFKKVDFTLDGIKSWGFEQENHLFTRDSTEGLKDIRRKTKVDPDTQKLASYYEVMALKSQVTFLQQIIEEMRDQVEVLKVMKGVQVQRSIKTEQQGLPLSLFTNIPSKIDVKSEDNSKILSSTRKRIRVRRNTLTSMGSASSFEQLCAAVAPTNSMDLCRMDSLGLGPFPDISLSDVENESFSDLFSDLELDDEVDEPISRIPASIEYSKAVKTISQATKVKEEDVSKIIDFLSKLSVTEGGNVPGTIKKEDEMFGAHRDREMILNQIMPPRYQKVGAS